MSKTKKIILSAMLLSILIIFSRFVSIKTEILVISMSFIPIMMSAIWLGYKYSMLIALLGDFVGAILFPFGPYYDYGQVYLENTNGIVKEITYDKIKESLK